MYNADSETIETLQTEVERLRAVLIAAQELLACGIINPTGWAKLDEAEAALRNAIKNVQ